MIETEYYTSFGVKCKSTLSQKMIDEIENILLTDETVLDLMKPEEPKKLEFIRELKSRTGFYLKELKEFIDRMDYDEYTRNTIRLKKMVEIKKKQMIDDIIDDIVESGDVKKKLEFVFNSLNKSELIRVLETIGVDLDVNDYK